MSTIKSVLALEDKMTPTLSKSEKQAISNAKAYDNLGKTLDSLMKKQDELKASGLENTSMYQGIKSAVNSVAHQMDQYAEGTKKASDSNGNLSASIIAANQALELAGKAWNSLKKIISAATEMIEYSNNQFNAEYTAATKIHNNLGANKDEIQSMYDYAAALQKVGVVGDEATISGMSTLSMYANNISQVKELTPAILDLAVAQEGLNVTQSTVESYAQRVGYALNGNATMLKRLIGASDDEIKTLNGMNSKTEKSAYLYQLIERSAAGANQALAQTAEGGIMQADNALGDMKETVGKQLVPYLNQFKQILVQALNPAIEWFGQNAKWLVPVLIALGIAIGALIIIYVAYTIITTIVTIANYIMTGSMGAIALVIIIVIVAILALVLILTYLWNTNDEVANALITAWDYVKIRNDENWISIKNDLVWSTKWNTNCLCRNISSN